LFRGVLRRLDILPHISPRDASIALILIPQNNVAQRVALTASIFNLVKLFYLLA
jgi:hypothetical protein